MVLPLPPVWGLVRVLTLVPHRHTEVDMARSVVRFWQRYQFDWLRVLIGFCAVFHLGLAVTLAFAPYEQIYNVGTAPVYELANRYVWAAGFLLAGAASVVLLRCRTAGVQLAWWFTTAPLGGMWWIAFVLAVLNGRGSAIGVVVWLTLYGLFSVAGVRIALGKR